MGNINEKLFLFTNIVSNGQQQYAVVEGFYPSDVLDFRFGAVKLPEGEQVFKNLVVRLKSKQLETIEVPKYNAKKKVVGVSYVKEEKNATYFLTKGEDIKNFFSRLTETNEEVVSEFILKENAKMDGTEELVNAELNLENIQEEVQVVSQ